MCGIAGRAGPGGAPPLDPRVCKALGARGPDGHGVTSYEGPGWQVSLAHTRLAINDLSDAGSQPIASESGRFVMVFNGEIYNYAELRQRYEQRGHSFRSRMDGEVILHAFEEDGPAAFDRLNGIFAVAVLDTRSSDVVLARDPLGVKPLFYATSPDGTLHFASELRALASTGADLGGYDLVAAAQFLSFLWVPAPRSPFSNALSLIPGTHLRWTQAGQCTERYCMPLVPRRERAVSATQAVAEGRQMVAAAAQRQLLSDVPVGLMASGGIDSGLIWAATHESLKSAFTIAWSGAGAEGLDEDLAGVRRLQWLYRTKVEEIPGQDQGLEGLPAAGDLFADPAFPLTRTIARQARAAGIAVLLSGQGGDELFGGYRRHQVAALVERLRIGHAGGLLSRGLSRLPLQSTAVEYGSRLALALGEKDPLRGYLQLSTYSTAEDRARALDCTVAEVSDDVVWQEHQTFYDTLPRDLPFTRKAMAVDLNVYMPGLGLAYVDRAGMEHGVEIRVPWLDLELVRWSLDLPLDLLLRQRQGKWLTRQIAREVLPAATAGAAKRGFGAPSSHLDDRVAGAGRGFRQSVYFARAKRLLAEHRETVGKQLLSV